MKNGGTYPSANNAFNLKMKENAGVGRKGGKEKGKNIVDHRKWASIRYLPGS